MDMNAVSDFYETWFEMIDGKPSLWDTDGPGRTRAVCLIGSDGLVVISTDPDVIEETLEY